MRAHAGTANNTKTEAFLEREPKKESVAIDLSLRALGIMVFTGRKALALALMVIDHPGEWSQGMLTLHRDDGRNHPAIEDSNRNRWKANGGHRRCERHH